MSDFNVQILSIEDNTHNVKVLRLEKPKGYLFTPGQAADVAVNKPGFKDQKRSFTFTGLNDHDYLELTIKIYNDHSGVTKEIGKLNSGDELIIGKPWGTIKYEGEGTFIAGGAGVTPFISIIRMLYSENRIGNSRLIFANQTVDDIINEDEFRRMLGKNFINILSDQKAEGYAEDLITEEFLKSSVMDFDKKFYLCGPPPMMTVLEKQLANLKVKKDAIIKEEL